MYKAFLSYRHPQEDFGRIFVARLEAALKSYAKPPLRAPMRIFRDEVNLRPGADLPSLIRRALEQSEFLVLLASPSAANSRWVEDELALWFDELKRPPDSLIIVLIEGRIASRRRDARAVVDWEQTDALPPVLRRHLPGLPLWVDFSGLRSEADLRLDNADFKAGINRIVARLRDVDPETMLGVELAQHRRMLRVRNGAIALVAALSVAAILAGLWAQRAQDRAELEALRQQALQAGAEAEREFERAPQASLVKALQALTAIEPPVPAVERNLRRMLSRAGGEALGTLPGAVESLAVAVDGTAVAAAGGQAAFYWKVGDSAAVDRARMLGDYAGKARCTLFSPSARFLALASQDALRVWELQMDGGPAEIAVIDDADVHELEFAADGAWLDVRGLDDVVRLTLQVPSQPRDVATGSGDPQRTAARQRTAQCGHHWRALSPDGALLLQEDDETAGFRRVTGDGGVPEPFLAFNDRLVWGGFSADGAYAAALTHETEMLHFRAIDDAAEISALGGVIAAAWHPALPQLAVAYTDHRIELRRLYDTRVNRLYGHDARVTAMAFAATGSLASGDAGGALVWWPMPTLEPAAADAQFAGLAPRRGGSEMPLRGVFRNEGPLVAFSADGARIARIVDLGGHMALVVDKLPNPLLPRHALPGGPADFRDGDRRPLEIWPHEQTLDSLAPEWARQPFAHWWRHRNGRRNGDWRDEVASVSFDDAIAAARWVVLGQRELPDAALERLARAGLDRQLLGPTVLAGMSSDDAQWLALAGSSGRFGVWKRSDDELVPWASGTVDGIAVIRFSEDGRWLALGGEGADVLLFDLDGDGAPSRLPGHGSKVSAVAFSPEGDRAATAGDNGALLVWRLDAVGGDERPVPLAFNYDGEYPIEELAISGGSRWLVAVDTRWNATAWSLSLDALVERARRRIARPLVGT